MKITNKLATVLIVLIIFLSLSISVYGEMNTKSYFYYPPLDQTYLFNNPQLQSPFDYNINSDEHADRINLYPTHLYDTDTQFLSESSIEPTARLIFGRELIISTDDDTLSHGSASGNYGYHLEINNRNDTIFGNLKFNISANDIDTDTIRWYEYSNYDGSSISWDFPTEFTIGEDDYFGVGYETTTVGTDHLNVDVSRWMNVTDFDADGYQLAEFTVTFTDMDFIWASVYVDVWDRYELEPTIISVSGPTDVLLNSYSDEQWAQFNFDCSKIEINTPYTFTVVLFVDLTDNVPPPIKFKPKFGILLEKECYDEISGVPSQIANMPNNMLFTDISAASASTNISNTWNFINVSSVVGDLEYVVEPVGPRADFVFEKNFIVSSDSDSLLNVEYTENLWYTLYMENFVDETDTVMGNLEFNVTTSNAIEYVDWEEYANWDSSHVDWYFPSPDFVLYDYDKLFTGFSTDYNESRNLNMEISRSFDETVFNSDGTQTSTFTVKFIDINNVQWIWGNIQIHDFADVNVNLIPGSLWTDAPLSDYWIDSKRFESSINPEDVELNKEYTFTVITEIDLPTEIEGAGIKITYKPGFNVGLDNGGTFNNSGEGYSTSMPSDMLFDQVTSASASSNISNIWTLFSRNQVIGDLHQINNIDSIKVEDFDVTPSGSISVNSPALISANVTGINLYDVGFVVIEPESGTVPIVGFMDNISDQYSGSWNTKIFDITNGTTIMEPLVLIFPNGMFVQDEVTYFVMGDLKINDSTNYQYAVALFNDTQLIDIWDDEDNSIFDQIEYDMTVFNPCYVTSLSNGPQPYEEGLIINTDFKIIEKLAPNIPFIIKIMANDDYHGDGGFNSDEITITVDNTPPEVNITEPANLEIDVDIDTNITATFNESMNSSTLNNSTVKVYIQEKIAGETFEDTVGTWNSTNFQGFIYTEQLLFWSPMIDDSHRTIGDGNITYSTQPLLKDYLIYTNEGIEVGWSGNYTVIGWLGDENVVIDMGSTWRLTKPVFEQNSTDIKTLHIGETWNLGDGYSLKLLELDVDGNEAWLALKNSTGEINNRTCQNQSAYIFSTDLGASSNSPIFVTYLNKVNTTHIELKYTWLISQDTTVIQSGQTFGDFTAMTSSNKINLDNDEDVILSEGDTIPLFDDFKFEVEDTANVTYRLIHLTETPVEGDISYNSSSNTVTFDPVSNLNENTDYFPLITTGAEDLAGNGLTEDYIWTFRTIDATPPIITDLNTVVTSSTATITWNTIGVPSNSTVKYNESGNLTILEKIDPGYSESHATYLDFLKANTTYFYYIISTDQSGNTNESSIQTFTTLTIPRVTIHTPPSFTNDSTPWLNATFDRIVASVWYILDGNTTIGGNYLYQLNITLPELSEGSHQVTVDAIDYEGDDMGNNGTAIQNFIVDSTLPITTITEPVEGAFIEGTLDINGTANDTNFKNYKLEWKNSTGAWIEIQNSTKPVIDGILGSWDTVGLEDDYYMIRLIAKDNASNSNVTLVNVTIDKTPPIIQITNPVNGSTINIFNNTVSGTISDSSELASATLYLNSEQVTDLTSGAFNIKVDYVPNAANNISVYAEDIYNNSNLSWSLVNVLPSSTNTTTTVPANSSTIVDMRDETDTVIELSTGNNSAAVTINITASTNASDISAVEANQSYGLAPAQHSLGRYIQVNVTGDSANITHVNLSMYYTESDLDIDGDGAADLNASTLIMYWYDANNTMWMPLAPGVNYSSIGGPMVFGSGHNSTGQYIWADLNHFSCFALAANITRSEHICNLQSGWNMVSVPVMPFSGAKVSDSFGGNVTTVFGWTGTRYQQIGIGDELVSKEAYWMLSNTGYDQPITGTPLADTSHTLLAGWNMVGPVSGGVSVDSLSNVTTVFGWTGTRYVQITGAQELELTQGYWMLASRDTEIQI